MNLKEKYVNPYTDFGFKKLFGTELNKDLVIDFLNEVVLPKRRKIVDLSYTSGEQLGATRMDRGAIFDLYCLGSNGERFIVEMQKAKQNYFKDRSVFYASFPIQQQAQQGDWNFKLNEVFFAGILDFVFNDSGSSGKPEGILTTKINIPTQKINREVRHEIQLKDQHCRVFYDKLTFI